MERHFDDELDKLNINLLKMATLVEGSINKSVQSLENRDIELAKTVIVEDKVIDELEITIEEEIIDLLALFQPMASDLRFLTTGMHINSELESIADLSVNIAQRTLDVAEFPMLKPMIDIPKLADRAKKMVKQAIDAFVKKDEILAKQVILSDTESNELRTIIMKDLVEEYIVKDGSTAPRAVPLILATRDLERICDHASQIAEDIIYMIHAKFVKHHRERL